MDEPLREGVDYYLEEGLFVLTRDFLLRRGTCCQSGCRHCPYRPVEQVSADGFASAGGAAPEAPGRGVVRDPGSCQGR